MITDILYRCPACGAFDWLGADQACTACGARLDLISRTTVAINGEARPVGYWYDRVLAFELPSGEQGAILKSKRIRLSEESAHGEYRGFAGMRATHYRRKPLDEGTLALLEDRLLFSGRNGQLVITLETIAALTIESDTIIIVRKGQIPLFFDFLEESGKKWEDCLRKALSAYYQDEFIEYYPRLRSAKNYLQPPRPITGHLHLRVPVQRYYPRDFSMLFIIIKGAIKYLIKLLFPVRIEGWENIPKHGAAIVVPNHCSFLDSVILGSFAKRNIWYMAKNSEFKHPVMKYFMRLARAFPVRRYTTDIAAVRNAIRVVQEGHILGVFPEGERCWDNRLLPFRIGTIRLLLALGRPVIPVGIAGAYALMPRWTSSIERVPVTIRIGAPLDLGHIPIPAQSLADIQAAGDKLRAAMLALIGADA